MNKRQRKKALKRLFPEMFSIGVIPTMEGYREILRVEKLCRFYRDSAAEVIQMAPKAPWIGMDLATGPDMTVIWRCHGALPIEEQQ